MDDLLKLPAATLFDAATAAIAAILYLGVAVAAIFHAPRDERARVFLAVAISSSVAYAGPALQYWTGVAMTSRAVVVPTLVALVVGSIALFHFAFVFPWRRPWLRARREWLMAAYAVGPMAVLWLAWMAPSSFDDVGVPYVLALAAIGLPLMILAGVVLPLLGLLALYKSARLARDLGLEAARAPVLGVFVSQLAGGILSALVAPLVHVVAPTGPWAAIVAGAMFGFAILMPISFAAGIWKYGVLGLDIETLPSIDAPATRHEQA
jgi:hypothetical protein